MNTIVTGLLYFNMNIKLYHWQTKFYSRHKASDETYYNLEKLIDRFIEALQGIRGKVFFSDKDGIKFLNLGDDEAEKFLINFRKFLQVDLQSFIKPNEFDLLTIRDEMLTEVNKGIYLFTLK